MSAASFRKNPPSAFQKHMQGRSPRQGRPVRNEPQRDDCFTPLNVARSNCGLLLKLLAPASQQPVFIEPSAGSGAYVNALCHNGVDRKRILALDINPKPQDINPQPQDILRADWMRKRSVGLHLAPFERKLKSHRLNRVVVGNPPYGREGATAREHLIRALDVAPIVAMLLPSCAGEAKWQRKLPSPARLVLDQPMDKVRFDRGGKRVEVAVHWQVWVRDAGVLPAHDDLRDRTQVAPIRLADVGIKSMWSVDDLKRTRRRWDMAFVSHGYQSSVTVPVGRVFRPDQEIPPNHVHYLCIRAPGAVCDLIEMQLPSLIRNGSVSHCGITKERLLAALDAQRPIAPPLPPAEQLIEALHAVVDTPMARRHVAALESKWRALARQRPTALRAAVKAVAKRHPGGVHAALTRELLAALG